MTGVRRLCIALFTGLAGCSSQATSESEPSRVTTTVGTTGASTGSEAKARCSLGQSRCSDSCVDLRSDPGSCGECGNQCPPGHHCQGGVCRCEPDAEGCRELDCDFSIEATLSEKIPTVGIVEWEVSLPEVIRARIDFGLDFDYSKRAPVDLNQPNFRTLLLGMKPSREYQFRIVVQSPSGECASESQSLVTGPRPNRLPQINVRTLNRAALAPGYIITGLYRGGPAYIIDEDGDFVWWYSIGSDVTGARMNHAGTHMWLNKANVPDTGANVHKVSMDGMEDENLSATFDGQNHSLAVLPDETVVFYAYGDSGCDDIKEYSPSGAVRTIVNAGEAHGAPGACHVNAIEYSPRDDTLIFSDLAHDNYTKVTRSGEVVWVLGGPTSDFTGAASSWQNQHGLHALGVDRLVFFNNGTLGSSGSLAIELSLDLHNLTVTKVWEYGAGLASIFMGDVQRLDNENTLVVYSSQGVIHEVDRYNALVQEITWGSGGVPGYAMKRTTLYGPPPK